MADCDLAMNVSNGGNAGKLVKDLSHLAVNFGHPKKNTISIEIHHGARKDVATLRTVRSLINNLIIGVTKGFKYKMRYVYAHFPINVNLDQNKETGLWEVEIRNFIGEKIVRRVTMAEGVDVEVSKNQKDELILFGNSLENVSQSAADIQQICRVRNKDIRKVRTGAPPPCPSWAHRRVCVLTASPVPGRPVRFREGQRCRGVDADTELVSFAFLGLRSGEGLTICMSSSKGLQKKLLQKVKREPFYAHTNRPRAECDQRSGDGQGWQGGVLRGENAFTVVNRHHYYLGMSYVLKAS